MSMNISQISTIIKTQLPEFIQADYPKLISFLESYYEWMEQDENVLGASTQILKNIDIDDTLDRFVDHFKSELADAFPNYNKIQEVNEVFENYFGLLNENDGSSLKDFSVLDVEDQDEWIGDGVQQIFYLSHHPLDKDVIEISILKNDIKQSSDQFYIGKSGGTATLQLLDNTIPYAPAIGVSIKVFYRIAGDSLEAKEVLQKRITPEVRSEVEKKHFDNKKLLLKKIKAFYLAKGSEKSYDFLFRVLFNSDVELKYPKDKLLKPSSGTWTIEFSIKTIKNDDIDELTPVKIIGNDTGAEAIIEYYNKEYISSTWITEYFLSSIDGTFDDSSYSIITQDGDTVYESAANGIVGFEILNPGETYLEKFPLTITQPTGGIGKNASAFIKIVSRGSVKLIEVGGAQGELEIKPITDVDAVVPIFLVPVDSPEFIIPVDALSYTIPKELCRSKRPFELNIEIFDAEGDVYINISIDNLIERTRDFIKGNILDKAYDINGDGEVTWEDYILIQRWLEGKRDYDLMQPEQINPDNVDGDGIPIDAPIDLFPDAGASGGSVRYSAYDVELFLQKMENEKRFDVNFDGIVNVEIDGLIISQFMYYGSSDFTLIGALDNNTGTTFIATGPAIGKGTVYKTGDITETPLSITTLNIDIEYTIISVGIFNENDILDELLALDPIQSNNFFPEDSIIHKLGLPFQEYNNTIRTFKFDFDPYGSYDHTIKMWSSPVHLTDDGIGVIEQHSTYILFENQEDSDFTLIGALDNNTGTVFIASGPGTGTGTVTQEHLITELVNLTEYTILYAGDSDFTLIGATNSEVGTTFTANGPGTGTGTVTELLSITELVNLTEYTIVFFDADLELDIQLLLGEEGSEIPLLTEDYSTMDSALVKKIYISRKPWGYPGTGYVTGEKIIFDNSLSGGTSAVARISEVDTKGGIVQIEIINNGHGYKRAPFLSIEPITEYGYKSKGRGGLLNASGNFGEILEIGLGNTGALYSNDFLPTVDLNNKGNNSGSIKTILGSFFEYTGHYIDKKGFLSDKNVIQDSYYYQDYSYVIRVNKQINEWRDIVKKIVHPCGLEFFGEFVTESYARRSKDRLVLVRMIIEIIKNLNLQVKLMDGSGVFTGNSSQYIKFDSFNKYISIISEDVPDEYTFNAIADTEISLVIHTENLPDLLESTRVDINLITDNGTPVLIATLGDNDNTMNQLSNIPNNYSFRINVVAGTHKITLQTTTADRVKLNHLSVYLHNDECATDKQDTRIINTKRGAANYGQPNWHLGSVLDGADKRTQKHVINIHKRLHQIPSLGTTGKSLERYKFRWKNTFRFSELRYRYSPERFTPEEKLFAPYGNTKLENHEFEDLTIEQLENHYERNGNAVLDSHIDIYPKTLWVTDYTVREIGRGTLGSSKLSLERYKLNTEHTVDIDAYYLQNISVQEEEDLYTEKTNVSISTGISLRPVVKTFEQAVVWIGLAEDIVGPQWRSLERDKWATGIDDVDSGDYSISSLEMNYKYKKNIAIPAEITVSQ